MRLISVLLAWMITRACCQKTTSSPKHYGESPRSRHGHQKYNYDGKLDIGEGGYILTIHIDGDAGFHLLESLLPADQQVTEIDDQHEISATVVDTAQLEWLLRGFEDQVGDIRRTSHPDCLQCKKGPQ